MLKSGFWAKKICFEFWYLKKRLYICIVNQDRTDAAGSAINKKTMTTLNYTTKEINHNYKIKVSGMFEGKKVNTLVGVSGLVRMVNDIELTNRLLDRAFDCMNDVCVCKLRRGLKISFYVA